TMVDVLRGNAGSFGMVSGVGMHMTKHAFDVYSTEPPSSSSGPGGPDRSPATAPVPRPIRDTHTGKATVAAYTVVHNRAGEPEWGLAICDLPDGSRSYARVDEAGVLRGAEEQEWVGTPVYLAAGSDGVNRLDADRGFQSLERSADAGT
ncbi:MAG: hypothetical protein ACRDXE_04930, partial [Acidimicrobiales bacterium]